MNDAASLAMDLIKQFEGCRLSAYYDIAGILTIGWGDTHAVTCNLTITQAEADSRLKQQVATLVATIDAAALDLMLSEPEIAALTSFAYNLGLSNLVHSHLWAFLMQHDYRSAAAEFPKWDHSNGVVIPGLHRRRLAEQALFTKGLVTV